MIIKERGEPKELRIFSYLNQREFLSEKEKQYYRNIQKGYKGEKYFDSLLKEQLTCHYYLLNDLLLKHNNTLFQIDSLMVLLGEVFIFEVKNYGGDFYYESERLYHKSHGERNNPLLQLQKSESLLRQLLHSRGYTPQIRAFVIFVNPEFTLYKAPLDKPFVFPTQINRYLQRFNKINSILNKQDYHIALLLKSMHIENSPITQLPNYSYNQLRKGITCYKCHSFSLFVQGQKCICKKCGKEEIVENAVLRNVEEFRILFPSMKITTNIIQEWCAIIRLKQRIQRILNKHLKKFYQSKWTYYE